MPIVFDVFVEVRPETAHTLVRAQGALDRLGRARFRQVLLYAVAPFTRCPPRPVVVDLRDVWSFPAAGASCLQEADDRLEPPARLLLVCAELRPLHLGGLRGLQDRWPVHTDIAGAVAACRGLRAPARGRARQPTGATSGFAAR